MTLTSKRAFVISDMLGQKAGSYLATSLLCQELARLGLRVTCFAINVHFGGEQIPTSFAIVRPRFRRGCRWDWPGKCLAWQARQHIRSERPHWVFVVGVTRLARYLLDTDVAGHLLVWELTNATPGNKHVDAQASRLLGRCRAVLSPSQTIDQNIRLNHGYKGRILRLPFWIEDCQRASSPTPCEFLADFIYLGRRDVEKGLNELIRATAIVARELPQVRVLIAGQGSEATFAALARDLGVSGNVRFQFFQTREEALSALKRCRCLVLPSYHEGYPLVLLEAARSGVPFIATAVGSVPELYGDTCAAILISPRDDHALAQAMVRTLSEAAEQYQMRRAAAQAVFRRVSSAEAIETQLSKLLLALEPTP